MNSDPTPLLTIAIPVYNSEKYIQKTLTSVLNQFEQTHTSQIQIVIVDNGSSDQTLAVIEKMVFPCDIKVIKNLVNRGRDFSFDKCGLESDGKYIWFLGSQDVLLPNSLKIVLEVLSEKKYTNILMNFSVENEINPDLNRANHYSLFTDKHMFSPYLFYRRLGGGALAMSANIILKDNYLKVVENPLITKDWALYQRFFESSLIKDSALEFYFISNPIFTLFQEKDGWWTTPEVFLNFVGLREIQSTSWKKNFAIFLFLTYRGNGKALRNSVVLGRRTGYKPTLKMCKRVISLGFFDPRIYIALVLLCSPKKVLDRYEVK
jgi:glycosyltransferase involved in cell wall biosynthesis